ncbi:MAG: translocation/assembly module TamB domain-containing protein [Saprospiraceae bacterium]
MDQQEVNTGEEAPKNSKGNRWWRHVTRLLLAFMSALVLLMLIFHIPAVQNWAVNQLTQTLSKRLGTRAEVGYLYLKFFDQLVLEDTYIEDVYGDTLLAAKNLNVDFSLNPIKLLRGQLFIEEISISHAQLKQRREAGESLNTLAIALNRLFPPKDKANNNSFQIDLEQLYLDEIRFEKNDKVQGQQLAVYIPNGVVNFNHLDLPGRIVDIRSVEIHRPEFTTESFERDTTYPAILNANKELPRVIDTNLVDTVSLHFMINYFRLQDGKFSLHNYRKAPVRLTEADELDYAHMDVHDIDISIDSFNYYRDTYSGKVNNINFQDASGFQLEELSSTRVIVSPDSTVLDDLLIQTPQSLLGDNLSFRYRGYTAFRDFVNRVRLDIQLNQAAVALKDIMTFAPGLRNNVFFRNNRNEILTIDGQIKGPINNLSADDLSIVLRGKNATRNTSVRGNFSSRELATRGEEFLNLELESLVTDMRTLRQLIPNFAPPENFDRLGRLNFKGSFGGFFVSFFATGNLRTDIGQAKMDMNMTLGDSRDKATYSGSLDLINFDLGAWSANPNFGMVNFTSQVNNGVGLTLETANADLVANIANFSFKGYNYENANVVGRLTRNFFQGDFIIQDNNIDLFFRGKLDFRDTIPSYDFSANVERLDLKSLNLSRQGLVVAGQFDLALRSKTITDIKGNAMVRQLSIVKDNDQIYQVDSFYVRAYNDTNGNDNLRLRSDIGQAGFTGKFNLQQIGNAFLGYLQRYYPEFSRRLKLPNTNVQLETQNFDYDVEITDTKGLASLLNPNLGDLKDVRLKGYFRGDEGLALVDLDIPYFRYAKIELQDIAARFDGEPEAGSLYFVVDSTIINGNYLLSTVQLSSLIEGDSIDFTFIHSSGTTGLVEDLNLDGLLYLPDSTNYEIRFKPSDLTILDNNWNIDENNFITFGKNYIDTRHFEMTNGEKTVQLEKIGEKGLRLWLRGFDFNIIDEQWHYNQLDFDGKVDANVAVQDVFNFKNFSATIEGDTFLINQRDFGRFRLDANAEDLRSQASLYMSISLDTMQLLAQGTFNLADARTENDAPLRSYQQANYFDIDVDISAFPLDIAEFFISNSVSEVKGHFSSHLELEGLPSRPNIKGHLIAERGSFKVNFLNTRYRFNSAFADIDNYLFDLSGTILYDKYNHRAVLIEGISHDHLRDFGFDARLRTSRFLALDTHKGDNDLFYGHALGQGTVQFGGTFQQPEIYVNATVGDSSNLVIPVSNEREISDLNYVRWSKADELNDQDKTSNIPTGVGLEMDLVVKEEATMQIIFDELAGDIIRGSGRGNIRILVPRGSDFQMYGDYVIEKGNYLFTLYNVVNKDFRIRQGGIIRWNGDPFEAQISLAAEYQDLKTPVANFIQEYLLNASSAVKQDASNSTDVNLILKLQGDLLHPVIDFDIIFPDLKGELETYAENKLRLLRQDQNELNRQVFGLIVVGQFLPSDLSFRGTDIIYNTVSEFISNQLSLLLTELFSEVIGEGKVLSGIDFDIAYNQYRSIDLNDQISSGEAFELSVTQNFFDDRLSIQVGGNVNIDNALQATPESSGTFVGNDLVIEYILNPKLNTLKLRIYQRLQPDIGGGQRLQIGGGLSYRKEFNSFREFWQSFRKDGRRMQDSQ